LLLHGHSVVTTAASEATGGNIRVTAASLVRLQDSQLTEVRRDDRSSAVPHLWNLRARCSPSPLI